MKSNSAKQNRFSNENRPVSDELLERLFTQARAQFGDVIKSFWFYDGDFCPGCLARPIGMIKIDGEKALAVNAFIYRPRGILIGYLLCETCATFLFKEAQKNPYQQTPLHADIEQNLIAAYHEHLMSLDA